MLKTAGNPFVLALLGISSCTSTWAAEWRFEPKFGISERYTDNIALQTSGPQASFVTEVIPGFSLLRRSAGMDLSVDYGLHGTLYSHDPSLNSKSNQLASQLYARVLGENLVIASSATINQHNINEVGKVGVGSYNLTNNRTEIRSFTIGPSWQNRFGEYAQFNIKGQVRLSESDNNSTFSAAQNANLLVKLTSGTEFSKTPWGLSYRLQVDDSTSKVRISSLVVNTGYQVAPKTRLVATVGQDENDQSSAGFDKIKGSNWSLGLTWNPSQRSQFEASAGRRYGNTSYALNFSNRSAKTFWTLRYSENVTDSVSQLSAQAAYDTYRCNLSTVRVPAGSAPPDSSCVLDAYASLVPASSITNGFYIEKAWSGSLSLLLNEQTFTVALNQGRSEELTLGTNGSRYSLGGIWDLRLSPRMLSTLSYSTNHVTSSVATSDNWTLSWALTRRLSGKATGTLEVHHFEGNNSDSGTDAYKENSASAWLNMSF